MIERNDKKISSIMNSFGNGPGERRPCDKAVRRMLRADGIKRPSRKLVRKIVNNLFIHLNIRTY